MNPNIGKQIIVIYIWKVNGKGYIHRIFGKSSLLDLEPSKVINFSLLLIFQSEVFVDVWLSLDKSIGEFSMVYKNMSALIWLRVFNHNFSL